MGLTVIWTDDLSLIFKDTRKFCLSLGCAVLDIGVPQSSLSARLKLSTLPSLITNGIIIAVACSDFNVRVLSLPLEPTESSGLASDAVVATIPHRSIPTSVSLTWTLASRSEGLEDDETFDGDENAELPDFNAMDVDLLVTSSPSQGYSKILVTKVILNNMKDSTSPMESHIPFQQAMLPHAPIKVSFSPATYPSRRHSQILVPCRNGNVYIYDPFVVTGDEKAQGRRRASGGWIASFATRFVQSATAHDESDAIPYRKPILDAHWALNGQVIIALLSDGEWGIWDVTGYGKTSGGVQAGFSFALWGMIGSGIPSHISNNLGPKRSLESKSNLPTMTPSTRQSKEDNLFIGQSKSWPLISRGGISVKPVPLPSADNTEDSIVLWHNDTICYIDSLQAYWSRAVRRSANTKLQTTGGSLFGPGLTRIEGIDLHGQTITSIAQLIGNADDGVSLPKATLLSTEHQLIISKFGAEKSMGPGSMGHGSTAQSQLSRRSHRHNLSHSLLSKGELDIASLGNLMDDMTARPADSNMTMEPDNEYMTGALALPRGQPRQ